MRKTKIVCTIGPASESREMLEKLIRAGMNVARFNFSHGTHAEHKEKFERLVQIRRRLGIPVAALLDTKGPEIRTRDFEGGKVVLKQGQKFTLTTNEIMGNEEICAVSYKNLPHDVKAGGTILIDDGLIELHIDEVTETDVICTVINGGPVSNHKGINVPDVELSMPFVSEQDRSDIIFGCEMGYDFVALSFTRTKEDVLEVKELIDAHDSKMKIIAKIENMQGVKNLDEILSVADGIMVARGDLGVEVPLEQVPSIQKTMIRKAQDARKIVITATQMLDSMIHNPRPTRAETTDVANAIYEGSTAVMLSGETAAGAYPVEALSTMGRIAEATEKDIDYGKRMNRIHGNDEMSDITTAVSHATCSMAEDIHADAIITVSISGFTAIRLSNYKPTCPIIACTISADVARKLNLEFGVLPFIISEANSESALFDTALAKARNEGLVKAGDTVILTAGVPLGVSGNTNMIRVIEVE